MALNFIIGENGILRHAELIAEKYENKATEEENMLAQAEQYLANYRANEDTNNIYSVEEQVVGKWIDGKKLYRKVINDYTKSTKATWTYCFTIENADALLLKYFEVYASNGRHYPFSNRDDSYQLSIYGTSVQLWSNADEYLNQKFIAIVEYNKTTD